MRVSSYQATPSAPGTWNDFPTLRPLPSDAVSLQRAPHLALGLLRLIHDPNRRADQLEHRSPGRLASLAPGSATSPAAPSSACPRSRQAGARRSSPEQSGLRFPLSSSN